MNPRHHPPAELLIDYAAGSMEGGRALVVDAHLGACAACRIDKEIAEAVGGVLMDALPAADLEADAVAKAMARIERPGRASSQTLAAAPPGWIEIPADVVLAARRRRWAAPGVWVAPVLAGARGQRSYILRVGAGMTVPRHTHAGSELVCVLKGAFTDRGEVYGPGDLAESDGAVEHAPKVTREGECVCLIAADNALIARDWIGRLFQPLVAI
jgi:putative transcriptional regulator